MTSASSCPNPSLASPVHPGNFPPPRHTKRQSTRTTIHTAQMPRPISSGVCGRPAEPHVVGTCVPQLCHALTQLAHLPTHGQQQVPRLPPTTHQHSETSWSTKHAREKAFPATIFQSQETRPRYLLPLGPIVSGPPIKPPPHGPSRPNDPTVEQSLVLTVRTEWKRCHSRSSTKSLSRARTSSSDTYTHTILQLTHINPKGRQMPAPSFNKIACSASHTVLSTAIQRLGTWSVLRLRHCVCLRAPVASIRCHWRWGPRGASPCSAGCSG